MTEYSKEGIFGDFDYGAPYVSKGLHFAMSVCSNGVAGLKLNHSKILVVGSGNGFELVYYSKMGHDVTGLDLYVPDIPYVKERTVKGDATSMPFDESSFHLVHCTEMLEHVDFDTSVKILKEIRRVGKYFLISIACGDDAWGSHINIKRASFWMDLMNDLGFVFKNAQMNPIFFVQNGKYIAKYNYAEGFFSHGICDYDREKKREG